MTAEEKNIIQMIQETGRKVVPPDGQIWLYGARARGDAHKDSDWDLLILLNKPKLEASDYDISPHINTKKQWDEWTYLPYRKNEERDKLALQ